MQVELGDQAYGGCLELRARPSAEHNVPVPGLNQSAQAQLFRALPRPAQETTMPERESQSIVRSWEEPWKS